MGDSDAMTICKSGGSRLPENQASRGGPLMDREAGVETVRVSGWFGDISAVGTNASTAFFSSFANAVVIGGGARAAAGEGTPALPRVDNAMELGTDEESDE